jgi:hypothetical protein
MDGVLNTVSAASSGVCWRQSVGFLDRQLSVLSQEAGGRDVRLMGLLLPEQPLNHL